MLQTGTPVNPSPIANSGFLFVLFSGMAVVAFLAVVASMVPTRPVFMGGKCSDHLVKQANHMILVI